jgi:hypothetical protein
MQRCKITAGKAPNLNIAKLSLLKKSTILKFVGRRQAFDSEPPQAVSQTKAN